MANEFAHKSVGSSMTQAEYEAVGGHVLDSQATGDIIYATSSSQLSRLGIGATGAVLTVTGGVPVWDTTWTPTGALIPAADDSYDLGSASAAWQDLFLEGDISFTDGGNITFTPSTDDTVVMTASTNGAFSLVTTDTAAAAANIQITADGTVDIDSAGVLTLDSGAAINIEPASGSAILLDGTISIDAGVVTGATSITSTDVTVTNDIAVDGTSNLDNTDIDGTLVVDGSNISLDSTTTLNIDNSNTSNGITIGTATSGVPITIGHSTSLVTIGDNLTVAGDLTVTGTQTVVDTVTMNAANAVVFEGATADAYETTLTIEDPTADRTVVIPNVGGTLAVLAADSDTAISATPAELNLLDGDTSVGGSITIQNTDGFVVNDGGTMKTIPASDINTYVGDSDTTYSAGDGLGLSGTTFSTDLKSNGGLEIQSAELSVAQGISQHDVAQFAASVADNDFLRIDGTAVEGLSAAEVAAAIEGSIDAVGTIASGVWEGTDVAVAHGGTGASTLTANGVLIGNGTSAVTAVDMSTKGGLLAGDGSGNPSVLAVGGTGGHVLTVDSGETTGMKWAAASGGPSQANQAAVEGETNEDTYVPPDLLKHAPGVAKVWCWINSTGGIGDALDQAYNVASITDSGTGQRVVVFDTDFSDTNSVAAASPRSTLNDNDATHSAEPATGSVAVNHWRSNTFTDAPNNFVAFGDQ